MINNHINLLPPERAKSLRQLYFMRLIVVAILLLVVVVIAHGVFLLPSYLYVKQQISERKETLATLEARLAGSEEQEVNKRVTALTADAAYLIRLGSTPKAASVIAALTRMSHTDISLRAFSFAPTDKGAKVLISGTADSREALRRYEQALRGVSYITTVELPISAYAKETDIAFTITLTGPMTP